MIKNIESSISKSSLSNALPMKLLLVFLILLPFFATTDASYDLRPTYERPTAQTYDEEKRNDPNRPFYIGFRYGRAMDRNHFQNLEDKNIHIQSGQPKVHVTPRTDKFFFNRYGKRGAREPELNEIFSSYPTATNNIPEIDVQKMIQEDPTEYGARDDPNYVDIPLLPNIIHPHHKKTMKCVYLGIADLYKCYNREIDPNV